MTDSAYATSRYTPPEIEHLYGPSVHLLDHPLAWCFDETDLMVMCDNVFVPWEKVFVMDDAIKARGIYIETPGHCYGNHQSNVRFLSKLRLIVGVASKVAASTGAIDVTPGSVFMASLSR